jgi:hypothetical protein
MSVVSTVATYLELVLTLSFVFYILEFHLVRQPINNVSRVDHSLTALTIKIIAFMVDKIFAIHEYQIRIKQIDFLGKVNYYLCCMMNLGNHSF